MKEPEAVLGRMTDAFFALDDEWRFTYLNDRAREILRQAAGRDAGAAELDGEHIWTAIPEAVDTPFYDAYHRAMETQESVAFEEYYGPLDTWFEVRAYPSETGLSVYFRDISEQKELESDLQQRDAVFREIYRVIADKESSFEDKVDRLLEIGRDVLGTEYGALSRVRGDDYVFEIVQDPENATQSGDVVPLGETNCERAIATERTLVLADVAEDAPELTGRDGYVKQGIHCYIGMPVLVTGDVYGTFCFYDRAARSESFSDWEITLVELMGNWVSYEMERRRRETELTRQRDRLDDFAHVISHDLRNPLNVAEGQLDLAREDCESEHLAAVADAHGRIEAIIEDTLTLARQGRTVRELESVSVSELANRCWAMVETDGSALEIDGAFRICADSDRLRHVFENLFRNSVEHGSTSSQPSADNAVEHGNNAVTVRIGTAGNDGFYVEDDGPGVPEGERDRVFELGHTTSDSGTGFGLAIVHRIAEAHGWDVRLTESSDGGARFEFGGVEFA